MLGPDDRAVLVELAPLLDRCLALDPGSLARFRLGADAATALVRLPFGVLVSRSVRTPGRPSPPLDVAVRADEALRWLERDDAAPPPPRDEQWRSGLPPDSGWQRLETVPDGVLRPLVRTGALTLQAAAEREGVSGAQPRAAVADALLDSVVLTVDHAGRSAEVTLRAVSALLRMGFLPQGGAAHVDVAGRWIRVVAEYGTVYLERPGQGLTLR